jgi:predicted transcriptional regulator YheO
MTTAKTVILTAIHQKGIEHTKTQVKQLAENLFCSEAYVKDIIRKVKQNKIEII